MLPVDRLDYVAIENASNFQSLSNNQVLSSSQYQKVYVALIVVLLKGDCYLVVFFDALLTPA